MNPRDLLKTAEDLVKSPRGKPRQANLLRATSTAYYALFHTLAHSCADLIIGGSGTARDLDAWVRVYRALQHGFAKSACSNRDMISRFPQEIQDFANLFITMQEKRHRADYDPNEKAFKSAVIIDINQVESAIESYHSASTKDKRAFASYVLLKTRA